MIYNKEILFVIGYKSKNNEMGCVMKGRKRGREKEEKRGWK